MSIAQSAALYQEELGRLTEPEHVDRALDRLSDSKSRWRAVPVAERVSLVQSAIDGVGQQAEAWVAAACEAKGLPVGSPLRGEEISNGPLATLRYLQLLKQTLQDIAATGKPRIPGKIVQRSGGQLSVPVMPCRGLFDPLLFAGFKAHVWLDPSITHAELDSGIASYYQVPAEQRPTGISLILGAGNVSSIPPTDAFTKLFHDGKVVLLKMNPVNEYLGPIFAKAFAPLIDAGWMEIIYGGAEVGAYAVSHDAIDEVHITGSVLSHQTIVWGPPGEERQRRIEQHQPLLNKEISSELGNVTPWIIVPGDYSEKELRFQAENVAASIVNNASFNCVASKVIVTHRGWPDRERFVDMVQAVLAEIPPRKAYYPGAEQRYERFAGCEPSGCPSGTLPWTLIRDVDPDKQPHFFDEESFVCVLVETSLEANDASDFAAKATEFVNNRLFGTLGCSVTVHPEWRQSTAGKAAYEQMLTDLEYGTVAVNHWSALGFGMMSPPWGGYPGGNLEDPKSGIGWVHNTFMLPKPEKTVLEGPLTIFPKPFWFPTHRNTEALGWKVVRLLEKPSVWKVPGMLMTALKQ